MSIPAKTTIGLVGTTGSGKLQQLTLYWVCWNQYQDYKS